MLQLCVLLMAFGGYAMALPAPRVRIDRNGYDIESPHAKVQFVFGHKTLNAFIEDTHQKMAKLSQNLALDHNGQPFVDGRQPVNVPQNHEEDNSYHASEEAARRVMDSPLFFDTVHHEKMVRHYAQRREDDGLSPLYFHSIRPGFPFYEQDDRRPTRPAIPFTSFFTAN